MTDHKTPDRVMELLLSFTQDDWRISIESVDYPKKSWKVSVNCFRSEAHVHLSQTGSDLHDLLERLARSAFPIQIYKPGLPVPLAVIEPLEGTFREVPLGDWKDEVSF